MSKTPTTETGNPVTLSTDCYYSPTGKALTDSAGRCTCVPCGCPAGVPTCGGFEGDCSGECDKPSEVSPT